jgi:5-methylcytosine-specific restriction endonuclease McrA
MFSPKSSIHTFCSDECRRAVRGNEYRKARAMAFYRDEYACTECGDEQRLECHHMTALYLGGDNSLDNLQTLCHDCHRQKHRTFKPVVYIEAQEAELVYAGEEKWSLAVRGESRSRSSGHDYALV